MTKYAKILPLIFLLESCIEAYDLPDELYVSRLVVSGMITNEPGPYEVTLSMSSKIDSVNSTPFPITNATVTIHDDAGTSERLGHFWNGRYMTNRIQGVVGRKYWLTLAINEDTYYTDPQELLPPGEIDSVYYLFRENAINQSDPSKPQHALDFMINSRGTDGYPNLFRWTWRAIHEMRTHPELRTREIPRSCASVYMPCPPLVVPDIPPCASEAGQFQTVQCSCCKCWYERKSEISSVSNNRLIDGIEFKNELMARVPASDYFFIRTFLEVKQVSVTDVAHKFWSLVRSQQDANGSIFQPNNFPIPGNIKSVSEGAKPLLGFFGVYGVAKKSIFINPHDFPLYLEPPGIIPQTCASKYPGASYVKPDFW